jgi:hypothetical protein
MYEFKVNKGVSSTCDFTKFKGYDDKLLFYFQNLRNPTISQLREDLLADRYKLPDMIRSGQIDEFGCLKTKVMAELRKDF